VGAAVCHFLMESAQKENGMDKFKSRKFWIAIVGNAAGLALLFLPEHADKINEFETVAGAIILSLTNLGYLIAQGGVDKQIEFNKVVKDA